MFSDIEDQVVETVPLNKLRWFFRDQCSDYSLLLAESDSIAVPHFPFKKQVVIPFFVNMSIDLSCFGKTLSKRQRKSYSDSRRMISKFQMSFDWSFSEDDRRDFYDNIYRPFIQKRHKDEALLVNYVDIFTDLFSHRLMRIKYADQVIAGGVVNFRNPQPSLAFFGVRDGLYDLVKKGALGAIYYFMVIEMKKEGFSSLYLGGSPPFLTNGVTRHKTNRLATIDKIRPYNSNDLISCFLLRDTEGLRDFLTASPFLYVNQNAELVGSVWIYPGKYNCREEFEKEVNMVFKLGPTECRILEFERHSIPRDWGSGFKDEKKVILRSARDYFI